MWNPTLNPASRRSVLASTVSATVHPRRLKARTASSVCWTPSSTLVTPSFSIRSMCSRRHQSGRVSNVIATFRIADCSFSASTVATSRASAAGEPPGYVFIASMQRETNDSWYSTGRAVIVPPITISSTLSTRCPRISNCSSRACTCRNGS